MRKTNHLNETNIKENNLYDVQFFQKVPENMARNFFHFAENNSDVLNKGKFAFVVSKKNGKIERSFVFFIHNGEVYAKLLNEIEIVLLQKKPKALYFIHNEMRQFIIGEKVH